VPGFQGVVDSETGELTAPRTDSDSAAVLTEAIDALASIRTPYWLGDSGVHLHALTSLHAHAERLLPDAVAQAHDQGLTWQEIGHYSGSPPWPQPAVTGTTHDQLDQDHPHNASSGSPGNG
jgi:hypothetical protein